MVFMFIITLVKLVLHLLVGAGYFYPHKNAFYCDLSTSQVFAMCMHSYYTKCWSRCLRSNIWNHELPETAPDLLYLASEILLFW